MAYSETTDLLLGSIPTPPDAQRYVSLAADEIDARIGFKYATPIVVGDSPEQRPVKLLLKQVNNWLASGRLVMALDSGGEDDQLHQYALYLVTEATKVLDQIVSGEIILPGVDPASASSNTVTGPLQVNGDDASLVESFGSIFGNPAQNAINAPRPYPYCSPYTW